MKKGDFNGFWKAVLALAVFGIAAFVFTGCDQDVSGGDSGAKLSGEVTIDGLGAEGAVTEGTTLTANVTALNVPEETPEEDYTYKWQKKAAEADWADIAEADGGAAKKYTPAHDDVGSAIKVLVSAEGYSGSVESAATAAVAAAENAIYRLSVALTGSGALTVKVADAEVTTAAAGATVTLTVTPDAGFKLRAGTLKVKKADNSEVDVTGSGPYTFTMPQANVTVSAEFEAGEAVPLTADIQFYTADYSSGTVRDTESWTGDGTANESWTLTAIEQDTVYFAVTKTEAQTVTLGGDDAKSVSMAESGTVDGALIVSGAAAGLEASATRPVFTVNTHDFVFEGGSRNFTLTVSEDGKQPKTVTVNARVDANATGAAVFLVTRDEDGVETLTRVDTGTEAYNPTYNDRGAVSANGVLEKPAPFGNLKDALVWVDQNTAANQEWLIRVEDAENYIPKMILVCRTRVPNGSASTNSDGNIKIRLRGKGGTERVIKHNGATVPYLGAGGSVSSPYLGLISIDSRTRDNNTPGVTLQLEKSITLKGGTLSQVSHYTAMVAPDRNSVLVMEAGSKITGYDMASSSSVNSLIVLDGGTGKSNWCSRYRIDIRAGATIEDNKITSTSEQIASGDDYAKLILIQVRADNLTAPIVFISKDAIIRENGNLPEINIVKFQDTSRSNSAYSISSFPAENDGIFPVATDLKKSQ
ncbi:MAG: hypothetical protein LBU16_08695 [Treponema sp.]|jgi:hypothetical protein|nr:hypothetical protein [Treponema sp.]